MKRLLWLCTTLLLLAGVVWIARKPIRFQYDKQRSRFLHTVAQGLIGTRFENAAWPHSLLSNYAGLPRYQSANRSLPPAAPGRVVFYGDSITDFWSRIYPQQFFPGRHYINRGITGQSTPEMVWRFQQDVIDLHPSTVVILAGTNDITHPDRGVTYPDTIRNLRDMVESAQRHDIRVILCSVPPLTDTRGPRQKDITAQVLALNHWLSKYAAQQQIPFVDYYTAMSTATGTLRSALSNDGTHPNAAGYAVMQPLAQQAIDSTNR